MTVILPCDIFISIPLRLCTSAHLTSINLGDKEAKYLVTYSQRNISNLVHILESLDQLSMEMKRKITIPLIKEVI